MNKAKMLVTVTMIAVSVSLVWSCVLGLITHHRLSKTEQALEIELLSKKLDNAKELIELQEETIDKLDQEIESFYTAPIYNIPLSKELQQFTFDMCGMYGIRDKYDIVLALMWQESNFDPEAVSSTNDYGIMQINAVNFTDTFDAVAAMDPKLCIEYGVDYLSCLYAEYIDDNMALMAYNMGRCGAESHFADGTYASTYSLGIIEKVKLIRTDQYYK